jgi:hypothetical protein
MKNENPEFESAKINGMLFENWKSTGFVLHLYIC